MLIDQIKQQMFQAMKDRDSVQKEILRVAMGEAQTVESRTGKTLDDDGVAAIVRKLVKSNQETLGVASDADAIDKLTRENEILTALLPATLGSDQIVESLAPIADQITAADNDGQAIGMAMKHLKSSGAAVTGQDVAAAVKQMRG